MVDYSTIKFYLKKNNLHYFTFSPNSEKAIKAVIHHLHPDMPVEDMSSSLEGIGFNVIKLKKTATRTATNEQTHVENLP
jgi:hypothetical protein